MKKRILLGLIVLFSALALRDGLFGTNVVPSEAQKAPMRGTSQSSNIPTTRPGTPLVTRVVDGDTIVVSTLGVSEKVRLIGVDTPETVDPRKPVQCFGKEASAFTRSLLENVNVRLEADPTQGDRDKYGRILRYVFLVDGTFVNKKIIADGYGHEYTYKLPYKYQSEFKTAERLARESKKGLWGPGVCE